jgi:hypothetical protein
MYHAHNLYTIRKLAVQNEIALDWEVTQFWSNVWPRSPQLGILRKQSKVLMESAGQLCGTRRAIFSNIAPDSEQIFLSLAIHAIARH